MSLDPSAAILFVVTSRASDNVLKGIYEKHLKAAAEQLTLKSRPGIVCLHLSGISSEELELLTAEETGLTATIFHFMKRRPKIYGVALMTDGVAHVVESKLLYAPTTTQEGGRLITLRNPGLPKDQTKDIFSKIFSD